MQRTIWLGGLLACIFCAGPAAAGEIGQSRDLCYWCMRDAIYADSSLIARQEANPDIDEGIKAPPIVAARADIHRWRAILGPAVDMRPEPCCYSRPRLVIR